MAKQTPLHQAHIQAGAKLVDFFGWDMPLHYGSQMQEHRDVREHAGMFDVSHMTVVDLEGDKCRDFLQHLLANDVAKLKTPGKALYTCMLNAEGGIIDDLITYLIDDTHYRLVVNSATREKDLAWIGQQSKDFAVSITERPELAMIAVQGPQARELCHHVFPDDLTNQLIDIKPFTAAWLGDLFAARTGYTGEDGYEIIVPEAQSAELWQQLLDAGVKPCGLGARDTLRLEAGLNLYGQDMTEKTSPLVSNLAWTVAMKDDRGFIGRQALEAETTNGIPAKLVGLILEERGVLRAHQKVVVEGIGEGEITSGSFAPSMEQSIALARVPAATGDHCQVEIRNKLLNARVVQPPFVRNGKRIVE